MKTPPMVVPAGEDAADLVDDRDLTAEEIQNLALVDRWRDLFNGDDAELFVNTVYHPDCKCTAYNGADYNGSTVSMTGRDVLLASERALKASAPGRRLEIERYIPAGNVVVVEALILDDDFPGFRLGWCGVLTIKDGLIISDHTYANFHDLPGPSFLPTE